MVVPASNAFSGLSSGDKIIDFVIVNKVAMLLIVYERNRRDIRVDFNLVNEGILHGDSVVLRDAVSCFDHVLLYLGIREGLKGYRGKIAIGQHPFEGGKIVSRDLT